MAYTPASLALSPLQQNEVDRLVKAAGLDASEFVWAVQPSRYHLIGPLVSALIHTPSGFFFRFEFLESALGQNRVSVFTSPKSRPEETKAAGSWEDQLGQVRGWLKLLTDAGSKDKRVG